MVDILQGIAGFIGMAILIAMLVIAWINEDG